MINYTPSTQEIRNAYAQWYHETGFAEFDRWYAEEIRKAKEEAWDKGNEAAWFDADQGRQFSPEPETPNPYWKED